MGFLVFIWFRCNDRDEEIKKCEMIETAGFEGFSFFDEDRKYKDAFPTEF